jgi:fumarylacetoacetate (FAA) hydrolase
VLAGGGVVFLDSRAHKTIYDGAPRTPFMKPGDTIRIEMKGRDGKSVFGAIEQDVVRYER